jgi:hypothetical protein
VKGCLEGPSFSAAGIALLYTDKITALYLLTDHLQSVYKEPSRIQNVKFFMRSDGLL